jgi:hypothetical protein
MYSDRWIQALVDTYDEKHGISPEPRVAPLPLPSFDQESLILPPSMPSESGYFSAVLRQEAQNQASAAELPVQQEAKAPSIAPMAMAAEESTVPARPMKRRAFRAMTAFAAALVLCLAALIGKSNQLHQQAAAGIADNSAFRHLGALVQTADGVTPDQLPIASTDLSPVIIGLSDNPEELTQSDIIFEESVEIDYDIAPPNGPQQVAKVEEPSP